MRLAVYDEATLEPVGTLDEVMAARLRGPIKDGLPIELPMQIWGTWEPDNFEPDVAPNDGILRIVRFRPLSLNRDDKRTFILFVDCHPDDLKRVIGFKAI